MKGQKVEIKIKMEKMWDDDNIEYILDDWKYLFGESEDVGDSAEEFEDSETFFN